MTLHKRLTWMLLVTLVPLGAAVGFGLYEFVRRSLIFRLDDTLIARAEALGALVEAHAGEVEFDFEKGAMPGYRSAAGTDARETAYFEVYRLREGMLGGLVARSESLGTRTLLGTGPPPFQAVGWNMDLGGDVDIRVLARRVTAQDDDESQVEPKAEVLIVVGASRESVDDPLEVLAVAVLGAGAVLVVAGWLSLRWAISRGIQPVSMLAEQVAAIDPSNLSSRLRAERLPPEIAPIQDRMNAVLARIEAAMQRERRFTTAVAHELRTPVAELRTLLEVASSRPRAAEESAQTVTAALTIVERLHGLVATMLRLNRIESGRESAESADVPLAILVREAIESARPIASARNIQFQVSIDEGLNARGDAGLLRMALGNIVSNAAEYADEDTAVEVTAFEQASETIIRIRNHAASLAGVDRARIGEPLWRSDPARATSGHLGLGITLSRTALAAMGATIAMPNVASSSTEFVVELRIRRRSWGQA